MWRTKSDAWKSTLVACFHDIWFCSLSFHSLYPFPSLSLFVMRQYWCLESWKQRWLLYVKKASGSRPILQEVVPRCAEASTAAGSRFNDCNFVGIQRYFAYPRLGMLGVGDPKCVLMMPCRIGINVECCTVSDRSRALWRKILTFQVMSDAFLLVQLRWDFFLLLLHMRRLRSGQRPRRLKRWHKTWTIGRLQKGRLQGKPRLSRYPLANF